MSPEVIFCLPAWKCTWMHQRNALVEALDT
jgi:hypothetical protein